MAKIRMGMVGGGEGAFIGAVHRMAAALDGEIELVCGAFSSDSQRSARSGAALHLAPQRVYSDYQCMMKSEKQLPAHERMQFVSIVTPNHLHAPVATAALHAGFVARCVPCFLRHTRTRRLLPRVTGLSHPATAPALRRPPRALW